MRITAAIASMACLLATACSAPAEEDTSDGAGAVTHQQAAAKYEFAEQVLSAPSSRTVLALGVTDWAVYSASKGSFIGLVMFAMDGRQQVRYAILVSSTPAADGSRRLATFEVNDQGKETPLTDRKVLQTLLSDSKSLSDKLAAQTNAKRNDPKTDCMIGIAKVSLIALGAAALTVVAAPVSATATGFAAVLEALGWWSVNTLSAVAWWTMAGEVVEDDSKTLFNQIAQCVDPR